MDRHKPQTEGSRLALAILQMVNPNDLCDDEFFPIQLVWEGVWYISR